MKKICQRVIDICHQIKINFVLKNFFNEIIFIKTEYFLKQDSVFVVQRRWWTHFSWIFTSIFFFSTTFFYVQNYSMTCLYLCMGPQCSWPITPRLRRDHPRGLSDSACVCLLGAAGSTRSIRERLKWHSCTLSFIHMCEQENRITRARTPIRAPPPHTHGAYARMHTETLISC